ncbi:hypothetical protein JF50_13250 [Pseudoalteromonas luteoviolacea]|uniref:Uncharacterized protein n=1 Tax=Pseudoalteromonas luteoviolacea TaxID=43657 RepID=A0A0C1MQF6_9GAMM|nr:hypothetical protein [Pseudoalteromonas luteoviolacea]KID56858.1 hypothetical protein JF50_13250 [Pseudoalteromonas luteoviolacea]
MSKLFALILFFISSSTFAIVPPYEPGDSISDPVAFSKLSPEEQAKVEVLRVERERHMATVTFWLIVIATIGTLCHLLFEGYRAGKFDRFLRISFKYSWLRYRDPEQFIMEMTIFVSLQLEDPPSQRIFSNVIRNYFTALHSVVHKDKIKDDELHDQLVALGKKLHYQSQFWISDKNSNVDTSDSRFTSIHLEFMKTIELMSEKISYFESVEKQYVKFFSEGTIKLRM